MHRQTNRSCCRKSNAVIETKTQKIFYGAKHSAGCSGFFVNAYFRRAHRTIVVNYYADCINITSLVTDNDETMSTTSVLYIA